MAHHTEGCKRGGTRVGRSQGAVLVGGGSGQWAALHVLGWKPLGQDSCRQGKGWTLGVRTPLVAGTGKRCRDSDTTYKALTIPTPPSSSPGTAPPPRCAAASARPVR